MITNDTGLRLALNQLGEVYTALAALRTEHPKATPEWFAVMAEGFIDHARQLQREIEEYTGVVACQPANGAAELTEEFVGVLREIDLDDLTMSVRNAGDVREVRCTFDKALVGAAKGALDRRVKVVGVPQSRSGQRGQAKLHVVRLEVLDEIVTQGVAATGGG
jgi:hypothetical protein